MKLSELIINYRAEHDLSQRQFAAECGLSNGYISMIERENNPKTKEKVVPTLVALQKLAKGMHMTLTDLLVTIDDMPIKIIAEKTPVPDSENGLDVEIVSLLLRLSPEKKREAISYLRFLAANG